MYIIPHFGKSRFRANYRNIAVLTSGGDAPGMNASIRAVVRTALAEKVGVYGVIRGYSGLLEEQIFRMSSASVANIIQKGGTILKTDRCAEFHNKSHRKKAGKFLKERGIQGLIVIGGDGSFRGAEAFTKDTGIPTVGIPGTIDNDIPGTDETVGFDTAINTALSAIDRIRDTASSHDRVFLVEVMGRNSGEIALHVGIAGGAETILLPLRNASTESIYKRICKSVARGKSSSIIVAAEGIKHRNIIRIRDALARRDISAMMCILGHVQRGGAPSARDRILASAFGTSAVYYLLSGKFNGMVGVSRNKVHFVKYERARNLKSNLSYQDRLQGLVKTLSG